MAELRPETQNTPEVKHTKHEESSLMGSFVSVMILGFLILASWVGVFLLFLSRN